MAKKLEDEINRKKFTVKFSEAQRKALEDKGFTLSEGCNVALERFLGVEYISAELLEARKYTNELNRVNKLLSDMRRDLQRGLR